METKMTKAKKLLVKAVNACGDNESLLMVYSGADEGNVAMTGDPNEIAVGIAHILANGVKDSASDSERKLANSILNGIYKVLCEGDKISMSMLNTINNVVREAKDTLKEQKGRGKRDHKGGKRERLAPPEFDPNSEDCISCEDFKDCATSWLYDRMRNAHKGNGHNNAKRTQKARKNGNRK